MSGKKLMFDPQLREALAAGSAAVCGTVASNFGPEGRNTIRDQKYDLPLVANTGRRILQEMSLPDAGEDLAAVLIREAALKVAATCGDGSITTTLLTAELLRAGSRLVAAGYNPMELRSGLQKALPVLRAELDALTVPFETVPAEKFAAACAKNDEVAENSRKAFAAVGAEGVITVEDTQARDTAVNIWDGVRYEYGLLNTSFMTDSERRRAVLTHPYVLLSNIKINSLAQIRRMLEQTMRASGELLIITNDMTEEVQRALLVNKTRAGLRVAVAKAPGFGDTRRRNMLALAAKTGSLLFDENSGHNIADCGLEVCAQVARAEIDKDATILYGFEHSSEEMTQILRRHTLGRLDQETSQDEREKLQITLSILNGRTAEILAGGVTEYEMFEKKYLYENTVRTLQSAARSGLVPGAGSAYVRLAKRLRAEGSGLREAERAGMRCFADALRTLAGRLAENAGDDGSAVLAKLDGAKSAWQGYDVVQHRMVDLREAGILTPRATAEAILTTAAETAGALLTTSAAVLEQK